MIERGRKMITEYLGYTIRRLNRQEIAVCGQGKETVVASYDDAVDWIDAQLQPPPRSATKKQQDKET